MKKHILFAAAIAGLAFSRQPSGISPSNEAGPANCKAGLDVSVTLRPIDMNEKDKITRIHLNDAEKVSAMLFEAVEKSNLIVAGKTERQLNDEVSELAREKFGIEKTWHKKIVRSGPNTMAVYGDNPPDRVIQKDDILFIDYGIIAGIWESDYAKTYVLGSDPVKLKLKNDVEQAWNETRQWYLKQEHLKSSDFYSYIAAKAKEYGWTWGGDIAGHIVGAFPHEQPADPKSHDLDVHPDNSYDLFSLDANGNKRHWILEIHFIDRDKKIGGYIEKLL